MSATSLEQQIYQRLYHYFKPKYLQIENQSAKHYGHSGSPNTGESHWHIILISSRFQSLSKIQRHQLVYQELNDLLKTQIHALSLHLRAPDEG